MNPETPSSRRTGRGDQAGRPGDQAGNQMDTSFGNVLDGLVLVDLDHIEPAILSRYMGKMEAHAFREGAPTGVA